MFQNFLQFKLSYKVWYNSNEVGKFNTIEINFTKFDTIQITVKVWCD